ncbi:hypothetical protein L0666_06565 [Octadecabacter sp. CECT 8868]|uniref:DUF6626 family protein n=1 Tax=Octadecabacter algicola TaxID=2909342 RepID=UPI001F330D0A|nr:DUF6626 family protein [Octadecabacter algicola]MCF2904642.1 hypothetical protein [Octadecabacter algicola]
MDFEQQQKLTLVELVYETLAEHDLVLTAEDFSTDWCRKSKSWYAERKHNGRGFSVTAAIDCLDAVNMKCAILSLSQRRMGGLLEAEINALGDISEALKTYLAEQHRITEVALRKTPTSKMLRK